MTRDHFKICSKKYCFQCYLMGTTFSLKEIMQWNKGPYIPNRRWHILDNFEKIFIKCLWQWYYKFYFQQFKSSILVGEPYSWNLDNVFLKVLELLTLVNKHLPQLSFSLCSISRVKNFPRKSITVRRHASVSFVVLFWYAFYQKLLFIFSVKSRLDTFT